MMEHILLAGKVKNSQTIQDSVESVKKSSWIKNKNNYAGRTDKGVHALSQCANFKFEKKIQNKKILRHN